MIVNVVLSIILHRHSVCVGNISEIISKIHMNFKNSWKYFFLIIKTFKGMVLGNSVLFLHTWGVYLFHST